MVLDCIDSGSCLPFYYQTLDPGYLIIRLISMLSIIFYFYPIMFYTVNIPFR